MRKRQSYHVDYEFKTWNVLKTEKSPTTTQTKTHSYDQTQVNDDRRSLQLGQQHYWYSQELYWDVIGAGILLLPMSYSNVGYGLGSLLLIVFSGIQSRQRCDSVVLSGISCYFLKEVYQYTRATTYSKMGSSLFGKGFGIFIDTILVLLLVLYQSRIDTLHCWLCDWIPRDYCRPVLLWNVIFPCECWPRWTFPMVKRYSLSLCIYE